MISTVALRSSRREGRRDGEGRKEGGKDTIRERRISRKEGYQGKKDISRKEEHQGRNRVCPMIQSHLPPSS